MRRPQGIRRRTFLAGTAAGAAVAATAAAPARAAAPTAGAPQARTTAGRVRGEHLGAVEVFRGVPYAQPPVGPLRFSSPRPPRPWDGVRDATAFAAPSLQSVLPGSSEDSLYANVWTPSTSGSRPVLVYIHGGGWMLGAGSMPTYDGARLAERGDLVVVTFNYRLGVFGFGLHEDLADQRTGFAANWGLQDQAALLGWVYRNARAFGGDPENITVAGTSAGGSSTWQLALLPELRSVIRRIVPISAAHVWSPGVALTPEDSRTAFASVAARLGTSVAGLRDVPAATLRDTWDALFAGAPESRALASGREYRGPVVDGHWMRGYDYELPDPGLPVLAVNAATEGSFFTGPGSPVPMQLPSSDAELPEAVRNYLLKGAAEVPAGLPDRLITAYRAAAVAEGRAADPLSLFTEIYGDGLFRYQIVRLAERRARENASAQYRMEFAHPVRAPYFGTPHEATSPFLFGTNAIPENAAEFGDGPLERLVSDTFIDLVSSFAHNSVPASPNAPALPAFSPATASTLVLGGPEVARLASTPKAAQLRAWDQAGWVPAPV
ncbi:carboxylesterase family protein [Saccharothrix sp. ST-888]|uniref:carboxylesterase family protein n=1 Tax=Saccharothrix sp. ST-888 TaxID=1427391 RepID=UPI0005ECA4E3|nr:carboxylesterase family protein [Saccharothrix sp. ST-888]KJK56251.1 carboxylesterase [Saccharothrix sp. ST-888]